MYRWLFGGLEHFLFSHILGIILGIIIPTDELIFFRGVGQPPTRWWFLTAQNKSASRSRGAKPRHQDIRRSWVGSRTIPWQYLIYITSHHITSRHVTSHHITSRHITSRHVTSRHVTSPHITYIHACIHTYIHTHRQTDRQTETDRQTDIHMCRISLSLSLCIYTIYIYNIHEMVLN